jgi:hypothetical protein
MQVESQTPFEQCSDVVLKGLHARPHAPQFPTSLVISVSQPFE